MLSEEDPTRTGSPETGNLVEKPYTYLRRRSIVVYGAPGLLGLLVIIFLIVALTLCGCARGVWLASQRDLLLQWNQQAGAVAATPGAYSRAEPCLKATTRGLTRIAQVNRQVGRLQSLLDLPTRQEVSAIVDQARRVCPVYDTQSGGSRELSADGRPSSDAAIDLSDLPDMQETQDHG